MGKALREKKSEIKIYRCPWDALELRGNSNGPIGHYREKGLFGKGIWSAAREYCRCDGFLNGDIFLGAIALFPGHECFFTDCGAAPGAGDKFINQVVGRSWIGACDVIQDPIEREFRVGITGFTSEKNGSGLRPCVFSNNENPELT